MILLDTSGLLANYDRASRVHGAVVRVLAREQVRLLSPFVLAELDYLLTKIAGQPIALTALEDVARGAYHLEPFSNDDIVAARAIIERYADLGLGLADASLVVLAERHRCYDILTLDQRHFRAVTASNGRSFHLLPYDAAAAG